LLLWINGQLPVHYYERPADIGMRPVQCPERLAEGMLGKQYQCSQAVQCPELPADIGLVAVQQRW